MINFINRKKLLALLLTVSITASGAITTFAANTTPTTTKQKSTSSTPQKPPISKTSLDKLVSAGTITSVQETAVIAALTNATTSFSEVFKNLVSSGTITSEQGAAIEKAMQPTGGNGGGQGAPPSGSSTGAKAINPPSGNPPSGQPGDSTTVATTTVAAVYLQKGASAVKSSQKLSATQNDQSIVAVTDGGSLTLSKSTLSKTGKTSSEDNSNFYGLNAGVVAKSASKITLKDTTISTNADGSNAVFSTGTGSKITVSNVKIKTTANSSRGLDATQKGTIVATNVEITTSGAHCADLATDRGNGTVTATNITGKTSGEGSPGIYSTGTISATNSNFTATGSEAAVVEGKNSITLKNTNLSGAKKHGVMLYQSFSGDAETGTSSFTMTNGSITAKEGPMFYITNTDSIIKLKGVKLVNPSGILISASKDSWGTSGSNGGVVALAGDSQTLVGDVVCDSISSIKLALANSSSLKGAINTKNTGKSVSLALDAKSKWTVTSTSYLTSLTDSDKTLSNILDNGHTIYYNSNSSINSWLSGKTITLSGGGLLTPSK